MSWLKAVKMEAKKNNDAQQRRERLLAARADCLERMTEKTRRAFEDEVSAPIRQGSQRPLILDQAWSVDYLYKPVSVREFIFNDYFLGKSLKNSIYPKIVEDLEELLAGNYPDVVLAGGQAWGKTRMANIGILYDIYCVSCLRNPAAAFGQIPNSPLAMVNVSVRKQQAMRVFFGGLYSLMCNSPYFKEEFPFRKNLRSEIQFCRGEQTVVRCYPVTANEQSVLGEFIFSGVMDEVNFMDVVDHSSRRRPGDEEVFSQAREVHNRLSVRIRGRLNQRGKLPGHLWIISSSRYPNDFTEQKEREARQDRQIFVRHYAQWDTKPRSSFTCNPDGSLKTFPVEAGDLTRRSRILLGDETDVKPAKVIHVPVDLRPAFEKDLERAMRDLAGQSTLSINPFIARPEMIRKMFINGAAAGLKHPLDRVDDQGRPLDITFWEREAVQLVRENLHMVARSTGEHKILYDALYYAHVDLSRNRDATGLCVAHVIGTKKVERFDDKTYNTTSEKLPVIRVDLLVRIVPPRDGEIDIPRIRGLLYQLRDRFGMCFGKVTFDTFGSQESVKKMSDEGFTCSVFSVDRDPTAYETLKTAIYDERVLCYEVSKLAEELATLEWAGDKVDHPSTAGSSKDLSDCLAAVVQHCEDGWRAGEYSRGLFQIGTVGRAGAPPEQEVIDLYHRVAGGGQPMSDGDAQNFKPIMAECKPTNQVPDGMRPSAAATYAKVLAGQAITSADEDAVIFEKFLEEDD